MVEPSHQFSVTPNTKTIMKDLSLTHGSKKSEYYKSESRRFYSYYNTDDDNKENLSYEKHCIENLSQNTSSKCMSTENNLLNESGLLGNKKTLKNPPYRREKEKFILDFDKSKRNEGCNSRLYSGDNCGENKIFRDQKDKPLELESESLIPLTLLQDEKRSFYLNARALEEEENIVQDFSLFRAEIKNVCKNKSSEKTKSPVLEVKARSIHNPTKFTSNTILPCSEPISIVKNDRLKFDLYSTPAYENIDLSYSTEFQQRVQCSTAKIDVLSFSSNANFKAFKTPKPLKLEEIKEKFIQTNLSSSIKREDSGTEPNFNEIIQASSYQDYETSRCFLTKTSSQQELGSQLFDESNIFPATNSRGPDDSIRAILERKELFPYEKSQQERQRVASLPLTNYTEVKSILSPISTCLSPMSTSFVVGFSPKHEIGRTEFGQSHPNTPCNNVSYNSEKNCNIPVQRDDQSYLGKRYGEKHSSRSNSPFCNNPKISVNKNKTSKVLKDISNLIGKERNRDQASQKKKPIKLETTIKKKLYYQLKIPDDHRITVLRNQVSEVRQRLKDQGLVECELILGIDCSSSNILSGKKSFGNRPLHEISPHKLNCYEQVIGILGSIVDDLSSTGLLPVYLFGDGHTKDKKVRPLFVDSEGDENCYSIKHVLSEYRNQISKIELSGPTSFKPLIKKAIEIAKQSRKFQILIIIGDGAVTEVVATKEAIIQASDFPISIIMIGVGDGNTKTHPRDPWLEMKMLEGEFSDRRFKNFSFLQFLKGMQPEEFAGRALSDVPAAFHFCKENKLI